MHFPHAIKTECAEYVIKKNVLHTAGKFYLVNQLIGQMKKSHYSPPVNAIGENTPCHGHKHLLSTVCLHSVDEAVQREAYNHSTLEYLNTISEKDFFFFKGQFVAFHIIILNFFLKSRQNIWRF